MKTYYLIGDRGEHAGRKFTCVEREEWDGCGDCAYFLDRECRIIACSAKERRDNKFVKLKIDSNNVNEEDDMKKSVIIGEKTYNLIFDEFEDDVQVDELLKIDYSNILGEMVTFPVIVNRFGNLLAEAESKVAEAKLNLEVYEAKTKEKIRAELVEASGKNPTVEALNNALMCDKPYQILKKKYIEIQKNRDYINSIFWSAKDKSEKLNKLSLTIQGDDVSTSEIEGKVNSVLVKRKKNVID